MLLLLSCTYILASQVPISLHVFLHLQEKEDTPPRIGSTPSPTYVTLYDFTGQDNTQLSFKRGETVGVTLTHSHTHTHTSPY